METIYIILIIVAILMFLGITISGTATMLFKKAMKENENAISNVTLSASELAKKILLEHDANIQVVRIPGKDNAYYDYQNKIIALSDNIFSSYSPTAQAIAMHEVGHAIQDSTNSSKFKKFKKFKFGSKILAPLFWISFIIGLILLFSIEYEPLYAYIFFGISALSLVLESSFKFLTLSMEKQASNFGEQFMKENAVSEDDLTVVNSIYSIALTTYFASLFKPVIDLFNGITWIIYNTLGRLFR